MSIVRKCGVLLVILQLALMVAVYSLGAESKGILGERGALRGVPAATDVEVKVSALTAGGTPKTDYEIGIEKAILQRRNSERISRPGWDSRGKSFATGRPNKEEVIAIGISSTTRGLKVFRPGVLLLDLSLFTLMLPSIVRTVEPGFEYWLYIAYDKGDTYFDNERNLEVLREHLNATVVRPLAEKSIAIKFRFLRYDNHMRKPGPVFNFMMGSAYTDGADYLYRINDDSEFKGPWAHTAVKALKKRTPRNLGVVGPICKQGNQNILTHDLVHRQHLDIFTTYYPAVFSDWWMDDWITNVYGTERTQWGPFEIIHHTDSQGTRYNIDYSHGKALKSELDKGSATISAWVNTHTKKAG